MQIRDVELTKTAVHRANAKKNSCSQEEINAAKEKSRLKEEADNLENSLAHVDSSPAPAPVSLLSHNSFGVDNETEAEPGSEVLEDETIVSTA